MSARQFGAVLVCILALALIGTAQAQMRNPSLTERGLNPPIITMPVDDDDDGQGLGFGQKIAGTWIGTGSFDVDLGCDGVVEFFGIPALDLHTIGVSASYLVTNPSNPNTSHGTWEKTGLRQLTSRVIGFGSDPNCTDPDGDGICNSFGPLTSINSITTVIDFDEDYQTATTSFAAYVFFDTTVDPLDPEAMPNICTTGSHMSFKKVNALE